MPSLRPTYEFYTDEWKGSLSEDAFSANLGKAASLVNYLVGYNEVGEDVLTAYQRAICAAAEAYATFGEGGGFSIGNFSMSGVRSGKDIAMEDARRELATTGLLFSGVPYGRR